jgi:hypothetical protein
MTFIKRAEQRGEGRKGGFNRSGYRVFFGRGRKGAK